MVSAFRVFNRSIQNLLLDPESGILKLCDFGSAKHLVRGEPNVSYICSRYYRSLGNCLGANVYQQNVFRAPELIFGATDYTTNIDVWSAGCVFAELMLGQVGDDGWIGQSPAWMSATPLPVRLKYSDLPVFSRFSLVIAEWTNLWKSSRY